MAQALQGDPSRAVRMLGAAQALRESLGAPPAPVFGAAYERALKQLRMQLDAERFEDIWSRGHTLGWEQVAALEPAGLGL